MAARLLEAELDSLGGRAEVLSAGLAAAEGLPATAEAVRALEELGLDLGDHLSRGVDGELVRGSSMIVVMTRAHRESMVRRFPEAADRIFLLGDFLGGGEPMEIADPIGSPLEEYRRCRDTLRRAMPAIARFLMERNAEAKEAAADRAENPRVVAVGSDHGGCDLRAVVIEKLQGSGFEVLDYGTATSDSVDYPDYAFPVADAVAGGVADRGILICTTGIGMSITANRARGVRAALCREAETARMARRHNNANILVLPGGAGLDAGEVGSILDVFLRTPFDGGRHARRIGKIDRYARELNSSLRRSDPDLYAILQREWERQSGTIELIASENFTSPAVLEAQGSVLTNKYAEGYPGRRWYDGCEHVDEAESLAIERARELFGAEHANVQPHSGSQANMAAYFAVLQTGDTVLGMDLAHGGHLTHGLKVNFSGRLFRFVAYGVDAETERIDYGELERLAGETKPRMILAGASSYPRTLDFERLSAIARSVDALLMVDMAHIAGIVAAGLHPNPVPYADIVTTTTHKTLRGPRGGLILCRSSLAKDIDRQIFPGIQGGPLMHVIAAKAACLGEALRPDFRDYQQRVLSSARALGEELSRRGFRLVSGGTDTHLILVDLRPKGVTGKEAATALDRAGITANKNVIPFDPNPPGTASGIRLGTPAVVTRGMGPEEMRVIAELIDEAIARRDDPGALDAIRRRSAELVARFPLPGADPAPVDGSDA